MRGRLVCGPTPSMSAQHSHCCVGRMSSIKCEAMLALSNDLWEDIHTMHGNHHVFATCKFLSGTRPRWLFPENDALGNLQHVKWKLSAGYRFDDDSCGKVALNGHLKVLQWLRANESTWDRWREWACVRYAAEGGHLEVLQWLRSTCPWDEDNEWICVRYATEGGHLKVLQWLRANVRPGDDFICACAALGGHFEVLQWLHANGWPWNENTCEYAARGGHLEILQWARENRCPWDRWTCHAAAGSGHMEVLQWARANGCPWNLSLIHI